MSTRPQKLTKIRRGSVVTKVYRIDRKDGREVYAAAWHVGGHRVVRQFSTYAAAHGEASLKADQLAAGKVDAASHLSSEDASTLTEARRVCGTTPILSALAEWAKARRLCAGPIIPAAEAWAARNKATFEPITIANAINQFIAAKERAGHEGERTYRSKLSPLAAEFGDETRLDDLSPQQLDRYLARFADGVTRNDFRKRAVTLWRWARDNHHLPEGVPLAIERTMRAKEKATEIGILTPPQYRAILEFIRDEHPEHLAAVVLAGFCGIRADEIHGKRADRSKRQTWEDVHLDKRFVRVSVAKTNTPAWRNVPLCPAAVAWLMLCPDRKGDVCEVAALERVRWLLRHARTPDDKPRFPELPENAFRHSFITYRVALTGNKPLVASEAGNSVKEIDRRYRVPVTKADGKAWFAIRPEGDLADVEEMPATEKATA